ARAPPTRVSRPPAGRYPRPGDTTGSRGPPPPLSAPGRRTRTTSMRTPTVHRQRRRLLPRGDPPYPRVAGTVPGVISNAFTGAALDRAGDGRRLDSDWLAAQRTHPGARALVAGDRGLRMRDGHLELVPLASLDGSEPMLLGL